MLNREEMMDRVIRDRGFEAKETIWFCRLYEEDVNDDTLLAAFLAIMTGCFDVNKKGE